MKFTSKKPHYEHLRKKLSARQRAAKDNFWTAHGDSLKHLAVGSLGGLMLLSPTTQQIPEHNIAVSKEDILKDYDQNVLLAQTVSPNLKHENATVPLRISLKWLRPRRLRKYKRVLLNDPAKDQFFLA